MKILSGVLGLLLILGCQTTSAVTKSSEREEMQATVDAVKEAIRNRNIQAKYCPVCGNHYSGRLDVCPIDQTLLKSIEE